VTQVRFGEFVLDGDTRELRHRGGAVHLSPKAFQLLDALVAARPKALSKDELHDRLWPDSFVVEANLANLVGEIRAALGDNPRRPRYLRTVHRFGYAFQAEGKEPADARRVPAGRLTWKGGRAVLQEGEHVLGRDPALELFFDAATVSRRHARLVVRGADVTVEDLGSKNGTFVGDRKVDRPAPLVDGDRVRLGSFVLTFRREPSEPTKTATATR
jgi:DNA-binding winged helix-turn-helix (wHTH) protein